MSETLSQSQNHQSQAKQYMTAVLGHSLGGQPCQHRKTVSKTRSPQTQVNGLAVMSAAQTSPKLDVWALDLDLGTFPCTTTPDS